MTLKKIIHPKLDLKGISHGFFTRKGGCSKHPFNSLNCSFNVDDKELNVKKNLKYVCNELKLDKLVGLNQIHSSKIFTIQNTNNTTGPIKADGLVTNLKGIGLSILGADCAPILFYEHGSKIIGACHAGWRGTMQGVIEATIKSMENLGAERQNITAVIGPTIHKESYEIKNNLAQKIKETFIYKKNNSILSYLKDDSYLLDLPLFIKEILKKTKIQNVNDINVNTYEKSDLFFSHRKSTHENFPKEGKTGRHISVIGMLK